MIDKGAKESHTYICVFKHVFVGQSTYFVKDDHPRMTNIFVSISNQHVGTNLIRDATTFVSMLDAAPCRFSVEISTAEDMLTKRKKMEQEAEKKRLEEEVGLSDRIASWKTVSAVAVPTVVT